MSRWNPPNFQDIAKRIQTDPSGTGRDLDQAIQIVYQQASTIPAFVDAELVSGGGINWWLTSSPSPVGSLLLVAYIAGFGGVILVKGRDYTITGVKITTSISHVAGNLYAWYRK